MTRYFIFAYTLFVASFLLLLGVGKYPNDNYSVTIFGFGRFGEGPTYLTAVALTLAGAWNFVQWRKTRSGLATTSIHFVLANFWYLAGLLFLVGTWAHPSSTQRATIFGFGRFEIPAIYLFNIALFFLAMFSLRWWWKAGRPGVSEGNYFALANICLYLGIAFFLGIATHPSSNHHAAIYGYGKLETFPAYLAVGLLFVAAFSNFRRWRRTKIDAMPVPVPPPVRVVHEGRTVPWPYLAFGAIAIVVILAMFITTTGTSIQPRQPNAIPVFDVPMEIGADWEPDEIVDRTAYMDLPTRRGNTGSSVFLAIAIAMPTIGLLWMAGSAIYIKLNRRTNNTGQVRLRDVILIGVIFSVVATLPAAALLVIGTQVPINERLEWQKRYQWIAMGPIFVCGPILGVMWTVLARAARQRKGTDSKEEFSIPLKREVLTRPQKRLIAGWFAFLATVVATLLAVVLFREYGRSDSNFNRIVVFLVFWSIIALAISNGLYRWAYPEWYANRIKLLAPDLVGPRGEQSQSVPATESGIGYRIILGLWIVLTPATMLNICMVLITPNRYPHLPVWGSILVFLGGWVVGVGLPTFIRFLWINREPSVRPLRESVEQPREPKQFQHESEPVAAPLPPPTAARDCPRCAAPLAADSPMGLCPRCLMAGAFQSILNPSRTGPYSGPFAPPTPEEVQEHFPNLEILGLIGHGGMGAVYQARQPNLDRIVALKLIRPREDNPMFAERFVREAKAMAKLTHPNIATIFNSGEAGGSLFLLMEFIDGVTLREAIKSKALTPGTAMQIVGQLCDALEYAHSQGVVHRDIKPENILLDRNGKVKVVDFGLAKLADDNAMSLTHTRQAMGTPHYMAPEQWEKPTEVDHRADIYALGVVIYELLTGELPLGRFDPPSVKSRLDARIDEIVLKLLAKEPDRRYQHASEVRTALFGLGHLAVEGTVRQYGTGRHSFYEYKSETTVLGFPLIHFVRGIDPRTGRRPWARGVIAVGRKAIGVVAIGQLAIGLIAIGQLALGLIAIGQLAISPLLAIGQFAFSLFVGAGMFAFGTLFAVGLLSVGVFAIGLTGFGRYVIDGDRSDPEFWQRLSELGERILANFS